MIYFELYDYVFGDAAKIDVNGRVPADKRQGVIDKKKAKITQFMTELFYPTPVERRYFYLRGLFELLTRRNTEASQQLKSLLIELLAKLPPEYVPMSEQTKAYHFPEDRAIADQFDQLNTEYKYFNTEDNEQARQDFNQFFKAVKLICDFVEHKDPDQPNYPDVALLAYKILVYFGGCHDSGSSLFRYVIEYLKANTQQQQDLGTIFYRKLPINDPALRYMESWKKLIKQYGKEALQWFSQASLIEQQLSTDSLTREQIKEILARVTYKRKDEYPELAKICLELNKEEAIFDECLEIEKQRKKEDNLPTVYLDGSKLESGEPNCSRYYLVKLPIDDPKAYFLGEYTDCCQYIGNNGEGCVLSGVTEPNNGFLVLLKAKKTKYDHPLIEGRINYEQFDIVGQGYMWLSQEDNLVIDSWENLRPAADDKIVEKMLPAWANEVTQQCPNILRVTIGCGGKTPISMQEKVVDYPEKIAEGFQYEDSNTQALVYLNEDTLSQRIETICQQYGIDPRELSTLPIYSLIQVEAVAIAMQHHFSYFQSSSFTEETERQEGAKILAILSYLKRREILTKENLSYLEDCLKKIALRKDILFFGPGLNALQYLVYGISKLYALKMLTDSAYQLFMSNIDIKSIDKEKVEETISAIQSILEFPTSRELTASELAKWMPSFLQGDKGILAAKIKIFCGIFPLSTEVESIQEKPHFSLMRQLREKELLTDDVISRLIQQANNFLMICVAINSLIDKNLFYQQNIATRFLSYAISQYALEAANALVMLNNAEILTEANVAVILANETTSMYATLTTNTLINLHQRQLLTNKVRQFLIEKNNYVKTLDMAIAILMDNDLLDETNSAVLLTSEIAVMYAEKVANGMVLLHQTGCLTEEERTLFSEEIRIASQAETASQIIIFLATKNIVLKNKKQQLPILLQMKDPINQIKAIVRSLEENKLLTQNYFDKLFDTQNSMDCESVTRVANALVKLSKAGMLAEEYIQRVSHGDAREYADTLADALIALRDEDLLTEAYAHDLSQHPALRYLPSIINGMRILKKNRQLTTEHYRALVGHEEIMKHADKAASAFIIMTNGGVELRELTSRLINEKSLRQAPYIAIALVALHFSQLWIPKYLEKMQKKINRELYNSRVAESMQKIGGAIQEINGIKNSV